MTCIVCAAPLDGRQESRTKYCSAVCQKKQELQRNRARKQKAAPPNDALQQLFRESSARLHGKWDGSVRRILKAREMADGIPDVWIGDTWSLEQSRGVARRNQSAGRQWEPNRESPTSAAMQRPDDKQPEW